MVEQGNYYFPAEITEMIATYEELKNGIKRFVDEMESGNNIVSLLKLHRAITNYKLTVPRNMRERLTGLLFN